MTLALRGLTPVAEVQLLLLCRGMQTADNALRHADELLKEATLLCFDDFQGQLKRHARLPPQTAAKPGSFPFSAGEPRT